MSILTLKDGGSTQSGQRKDQVESPWNRLKHQTAQRGLT